MNFTEILENINATNQTIIEKPTYCIYPEYNAVILMNVIIMSILLYHKFNIPDRLRMIMFHTLHTVNLFLLVWNLFYYWGWLNI